MDSQNELYPDLVREEMFRQILDKINTSVVIIDRDGYIIYVNRACEDLLKVSFEKIKDVHYTVAFEKIPENERFILKTLETGEEFKDIGYSRARFNNRYIITDTTLLQDREKEIIGAAGVFRDITIVQELQDKLREKEKLSALGEVAKGMAHEIRNPLTTIQFFLQMISQKAQDEALSPDFIKNYSGIALNEVDKITKLINEFLELAKPAPIALEFIIFEDIINEVADSLSWRIEGKNIYLIYDFNPGVKIWVDKKSFQQMLFYIINNALDVLPQGGMVKIKYSRQGSRMLLEIIDNGPGIPGEEKGKIFMPFYTTKDYGTGLGLTLVQKIVNDHGGEIKLESRQGEGTNFKILLPAGDG